MNKHKENLQFGEHTAPEMPEENAVSKWLKKQRKKENAQPLPEQSSHKEANMTQFSQSSQQTATPLLTEIGASTSTCIGKETTFTGKIETEGDVKILGEMKGNVSSHGSVVVGGRIDGEINANSVMIAGGIVQGDIHAKEDISLDGRGIIIGNLYCETSDIDGKLKGNLQADGSVVIKNNAIIHGNITAQNIDTRRGAVINGHITIICQKNEQELFALPNRENKQSLKEKDDVIQSENAPQSQEEAI